ncbi:hypothetical protein [Streptomyces werraensis]|uniref:hypothetical protein n=1 Tax=Streptomyces werraensis TaxID=68284 RepID=UPI001CE305E6
MAQVRETGDEDEVAAVLEVLLPFVQASTAVVASAPRELGMCGPGRRVVFELLPAGPGPVTVERADQPAARRRELT